MLRDETKYVTTFAMVYTPNSNPRKGNRPVSYSNGWTGSSMKWRLMPAN